MQNSLSGVKEHCSTLTRPLSRTCSKLSAQTRLQVNTWINDHNKLDRQTLITIAWFVAWGIEHALETIWLDSHLFHLARRTCIHNTYIHMKNLHEISRVLHHDPWQLSMPRGHGHRPQANALDIGHGIYSWAKALYIGSINLSELNLWCSSPKSFQN